MIHADLYQYTTSINENDIIFFVQEVLRKKSENIVTPRSIIRDYIDILNILFQAPELKIRTVISKYHWNNDVEEEIQDIEE